MDTDVSEAGNEAMQRGSDDEGIFATVAVIGAGAMGSGIAQVAAAAGHHVVLVDADAGAAAAARERIAASLDRLVGKGRMSREAADATLERLATADSVRHLPECGLVIEAVPEDLRLKRRLLADLSERQPANTVLATNTSSYRHRRHRPRRSSTPSGCSACTSSTRRRSWRSSRWCVAS